MVRQEITNLIEEAIKNLQGKKIFPDFEIPEIKIGPVEDRIGKQIYGDYSSAIAIRIRKETKINPMEISGKIIKEIQKFNSKLFWKIEPKEPGFINFFISDGYLQNQVGEIIKQKEKFGNIKIGKDLKVNVEFISANPTGPLTLGNGRGGFCGDVLANVLEKAGFKVVREYYVNDVGEQIRKLGHSVLGDSEAVYQGDYILDLRKRIKGDNPEEVGQKAAKIILKETLKPAVKRMGIKYEIWFGESELHKKGDVKGVLEFLKKKGLAQEKEGALWFNSTKFGDDKDRVLVKEDGETTYLASDIAYLKNKFERGFGRLIYIWGADHYGYINRLKAAAEALGYKKEKINIIIMQLVRLFSAGKEVRMSKRRGTYVTLEELLDEIGLDVARFFFLMRGPDSHLNFDLDLAKEQSEKNPVYYIQYAHARICSIFEKLKTQNSKTERSEGKDENEVFIAVKTTTQNLKLLENPSELALIKQLIRLPEIIEDTAKDYQVQRLPQYALDLASSFHQFYRDCRVLIEERPLSEARLALVLATKQTIKNTLDLMGISAPEKM